MNSSSLIARGEQCYPPWPACRYVLYQTGNKLTIGQTVRTQH